MADFWWSTTEHSNNIHWLSWEKLCLPKDQGGLGFRDIQTFHQTLLAKQAWKFLQYPNCLFARMMKSRYFSQSHFLEAPLGPRPSYAWRSILFGRDLLVQGLKKNVGNGKSFKVWLDEWIEDEEGWKAPWRRNDFFNLDLRVSELIDVERRSWNSQKIQELCFPDDILRIMKIKPATEEEDFYSWKHNKNGDFSVKSAYWLGYQSSNSLVKTEANQQPSTNDLKAKVWELHTDPKLKVFLWKVLCGALPVASKLNGRGMNVDPRCQFCGGEPESVNHVLFSCSLARQIWALTEIPSPEDGFHNGSVFSNIHYLLMNIRNPLWPDELRKSFSWTLWRIWKNRNMFAFEGKNFLPLESAQKIRDDWGDWVEAQEVDEEGEMEQERTEATDRGRENVRRGRNRKGWMRSPSNWLKCNIGLSWSNRNRLAGCAWVLRNHAGVVLLHSRRAISSCRDKQEAHLRGLLWAIDSMASHQVNKVVFGLQEVFLVNAITNPAASPSFRYQSMKVGLSLKSINEWKFFLENSFSNRGASIIAQSVTNDCMLQLYVATGHPSWLNGLFTEESLHTSD